MGSIPSQGTKVSHVVWCGQKNKNKNKLSPVRVQFSMPSLSVSAVLVQLKPIIIQFRHMAFVAKYTWNNVYEQCPQGPGKFKMTF